MNSLSGEAPLRRLTEEEISAALKELPDWVRQGDRLVADFQFESFAAAFGVMAETAVHAGRLNHHPEWHNVYNKLHIELTTHDVGGISQYDVEMAQWVTKSAAAR